jgi:hypothetical protein
MMEVRKGGYMHSAAEQAGPYKYPQTRPFLLMEGGPLYHIEKRVGLIKANAPLMIKRAIFAAVLTWLPLLILSAIQGTAIGHKVPVPFLLDFGAYTRFLIAIPLLLLAEISLGPRIAEAAEHFVTSGVILEKDFQKFDNAVESGLKLRDSILAEIVIAILAYVFSISAFRALAIHVSTWSVARINGAMSITWAGWWLILVCAPLAQFLVLRWLWRLFLWFRFLAHVRQLDIQLFPTHPDEAGGIGFVGEAQRFFGILVFSYSLGVAGVIANNVVFDKIPLKHFAPAIGVYAIIALLLIVAPLTVFTGKLIVARRLGLHNYGTLATSYTGSFDKKWIRGENPEGEKLLGTADIQSLADLGNSYSFIEEMRILPVKPGPLLQLVAAALLPMAPLLLTVMPLEDILKLLMKVLM